MAALRALPLHPASVGLRAFSRTRPLAAPSSSSSSRHFSVSSSRRAGADVSEPKTTHFGSQTIPESEKTDRVAGVFHSVAESYDRMNDLMSLGMHRIWKDQFVASISPGLISSSTSDPSTSPPQRVLDVAGGTGDISFRLLDAASRASPTGEPNLHVTVSDINSSMLAVGRDRARSLPASHQACLSFLEANAEQLPRGENSSTSPSSATDTPAALSTVTHIPPSSLDLYTVVFGIRNFTSPALALREAYRVLRPGGVFACMEFSKVAASGPGIPPGFGLGPSFAFDALYKRWNFGAIPLIGQLVTGDRDSYQYFVESIERFPSQTEFRDMIVDAGFEVAGEGYENMLGGVVAIHKAMKPLV